MHKGVDIAREAPRLIVSATNEPLASIIVVQTYYTLGWAQKRLCIHIRVGNNINFYYSLQCLSRFQFNVFSYTYV